MRPCACIVVFAAMAFGAVEPGDVPGAIGTALDQYARGAHAEAVAGLDGRSLDVQALIDGAERWADASPAQAETLSRSRVAAAFLLDAVYARTRHAGRLTMVPVSHHDVAAYGPYERPFPPSLMSLASVLPAVAWGCTRIAADGEPDDLERAWWLLSVALLGESGDWRSLLGARVRRGGGPAAPIVALTHREVDEGHLEHARARLAAEPRLRLAEIVAQTAQVMHPPSATGLGPMSPGLRMEGRVDVLRNLERATSQVNGRTIDALERDFVRLMDDDTLAGEAALRAAYLRVLRRHWREALAHLDRAQEHASEPFLLAVADYLRGWVYERTSRDAEAIAAYRRAHAFAPRSPNLAVLLSAQLFQAGARPEAHAMLDMALEPPRSPDLLQVFLDGDARFGGDYVRQLREALR
jgi:hypothetical protein